MKNLLSNFTKSDFVRGFLFALAVMLVYMYLACIAFFMMEI